MALEFVVDDGYSGLVSVSVVCCGVTRTTVYVVGKRQPYRRNGAGPVLAGAVAAIYADGDAALAGIVVALGVAGTKIQVTITGIAATTLDWLVEADWTVH
jgi:hypothetical protein